MDIEIINKLILGVISMIGTFTLSKYNTNQSNKIKAELLEKFDAALLGNNKHTITELFRIIHDLRMDYEDIIALTKDDRCSKIIHALHTTPSYVSYSKGNFEYAQIGKYKFYRNILKYHYKISVYFFYGCTIFCIILFSISKDAELITSFLGIIMSTLGLMYSMKENHFNNMIDDLVNLNKSKGRTN